MKRLILAFCLLAAGLESAGQAPDSASLKFDNLLERYYAALLYEDDSVKCAEMDWVIGSIADSALRSDVAAKIFRHYKDSPLMGEESVALHVWDRWYADATVVFADETESCDAALFATFNRRSMLYAQAPVLSMRTSDGALRQIPAPGRLSIIFFYSTSCPKCRAMAILLPKVLDECKVPCTLFAVCTGNDVEDWKNFRESFRNVNPDIELVNMWDPEMESDYQMAYGVTTTPRVFAVADNGMIIGRRLEMDALKQILTLYSEK